MLLVGCPYTERFIVGGEFSAQALFADVFVAVVSIWIVAKFAGVEQATFPNILMAGMALAAVSWGFVYLGVYVAPAFPLLWVARYAVSIYVIKGIFSSTVREAIIVVFFARIGQMLAKLALELFLSAEAAVLCLF